MQEVIFWVIWRINQMFEICFIFVVIRGFNQVKQGVGVFIRYFQLTWAKLPGINSSQWDLYKVNLDKSRMAVPTGVGFVHTTCELLENTDTKGYLIFWSDLKVALWANVSACRRLEKLYSRLLSQVFHCFPETCIGHQLVKVFFKVISSLFAHNNVFFLCTCLTNCFVQTRRRDAFYWQPSHNSHRTSNFRMDRHIFSYPIVSRPA